MLVGKIDATQFKSLDENMQAFYEKDGDDYVLKVKGMVVKDKLDEFRDHNVELREKLEKFDKVDLDEYIQLKKEHEALQDKELLDAGKVDELVAKKVEVIASDLNAKLETALKENEGLKGELEKKDETIHTMQYNSEIKGVAQKAFNEYRIKPELQDMVMADIKAKFTIKDGQVVAMDGDKIIAGSNGNLTIDEHVSGLHDSVKMDSSGGHGKGGTLNDSRPVKSSFDKIKSGLQKGL